MVLRAFEYPVQESDDDQGIRRADFQRLQSRDQLVHRHRCSFTGQPAQDSMHQIRSTNVVEIQRNVQNLLEYRELQRWVRFVGQDIVAD